MTLHPLNLISKIEELRKEMTDVALKKGITSKESLHISQELDELLNDYEHYKQKHNQEKK
ncbi:Spo0E family sporulation regulatory protein-aspartic acid phosphatase [Gracilibacillus salitolerans]|uniref:Spo0E family sporulation regulatory protein-aspartic acid phosphatase n=1 Tax=Gracilibacillus salitolerans TaxID=2663022 RepID=A0A5Q2TM84_9BACI|nr:aspartyl-phosphate phosphatase Spo0E family protein [Gracilibacillus salitolerans]QGH34358.1 Spo0E family sporulation regulatory protein-aspartic acid phosphatase [Gracilibacillus salitolerans]